MPRCELKEVALAAASRLRTVHFFFTCKASRVVLPYLPQQPHCFLPHSQVHSHLYATDGRMVGTFQRIDIPILHEWVVQLHCLAGSHHSDCSVSLCCVYVVPTTASVATAACRFDQYHYVLFTGRSNRGASLRAVLTGTVSCTCCLPCLTPSAQLRLPTHQLSMHLHNCRL